MRLLSSLAILTTLLLLSPLAYAADDPEALFTEGSALMDEGRFADALTRFERAQRIDPGVGTQFNIGVCHQRLGHLATAYRHFVAVAQVAKASGKKAREDAALQKIAEIRPKLPYLVLTSQEPGEIVVKIDGDAVDRSGWSFIPVEPGAHRVDVTASMKKPWSTTVMAPAEGKSQSVVVPALDVERVTVTKETTNTRRTAAFVVGGVGALGLATGIVTGVMVLNAKATAEERCKAPPSNRCAGPDGKLDSEGADAVSTGKTLLPINLVAWGVGVVGLAVGTYLFVTSSKPNEPSPKTTGALHWLPTLDVSPSGAGIRFGGVM